MRSKIMITILLLVAVLVSSQTVEVYTHFKSYNSITEETINHELISKVYTSKNNDVVTIIIDNDKELALEAYIISKGIRKETNGNGFTLYEVYSQSVKSHLLVFDDPDLGYVLQTGEILINVSNK